MQGSILRILILTFTLWALPLILVKSIIHSSSENDFSFPENINSQIMARIDAASQQLEVLKEINAEIRTIVEEIVSTKQGDQQSIDGENSGGKYRLPGASRDPPLDYEENRRLLELNLNELIYTIRSKNETYLRGIDFEQVRNIYRQLKGRLIKTQNYDGKEPQRVEEMRELANIIQTRISSLQNPKDCMSAKKLVCKLDKDCGFGCQIHHVCYCLIVAYASGRMLVLDSMGWRYNSEGWEAVFQPLSRICDVERESIYASQLEYWNSVNNSNAQVLFLPIVDDLDPVPSFLPVAIPSDISTRLEAVHGEPHVWWVGQFMAYILKPQSQLQVMLDVAKARIGIQAETVGIHVRRTDKIGKEAAYHNLDQYMYHVEEYFAILEAAAGSGVEIQRRVFIASDDPSVILEARFKYREPRWKILGNTNTARSASLDRRYNDAGLHGIIQDVMMLSECNFIVCTFSSQVCRLAYELLQSKRVDGSGKFVSLDNIYHYGGGNPLHQEVIIAHTPRTAQELQLRLGDELILAGSHWNGTSTGTNLRTNKVGLYPSYKAKNVYTKISFPETKWWTGSGEL